MLISKIHPNREEYEEQQNKLLDNLRYQTTGLSLEENLRMQALSRATHASKLKKMSSVDSLGPESPPASSQSEDALHPSVKKKVKRPSLVGSNQSFSHGIEADEAERDISSSVPQVETSEPEIEVIFVPLPHDGLKADFPTERRYIKTTTNATIEHLVKYLSIRHKLEGKKKGLDDPGDEVDESLFTLYLATGPGQYQPLHSSKTLDQIRQERFKSGPIHLHYAYKLQVCTTQVEPIPPGIL
jgi:E3 ubiquitin-protein ligase RNF1/2